MTIAIPVTIRTNCAHSFLINNYDTRRRYFLGQNDFVPNRKLSDRRWESHAEHKRRVQTCKGHRVGKRSGGSPPASG
jgi:hypothetical protein